MSEFEQHTPDDFWRKAFDEAAETPPLRVWDAIERQLDESGEARVVPLWGLGAGASRPLFWATGVAAALVLLLVGWWTLRSTPSTTNPVAQHQPAQPGTATPSADPASPQAIVRPQPDENAIVSARSRVTSGKGRSGATLSERTDNVTNVASARVTHTGTHRNVVPDATGNVSPNPVAGATQLESSVAIVATDGARNGVAVNGVAPNGIAASDGALARVARSAFPPEQANSPLATTELLKGRPMRFRDIREIQRIVWFRPAEPAADPTIESPKKTPRALWASVGVMPNAFDPSVSLRSSPMVASNSVTALATARSVQSSVSSRANFSVAYQTGAGLQLTEHWSIESGIGYLAGRSTVESPTQLVSSLVPVPNTGQPAATNSLFTDVLRNAQHNLAYANTQYTKDYNMAATNVFSATYDDQNRQSITNDYQFIQVPVQVGYQLRPRKRLGLSLLGGLLTNVFVRNTVGSDLVVTPQDDIYRPLSWAATMGARFRYRPSRRWSASLAGVYQPALGSVSQPAAQVQSHPTSVGMSFGVDYHFN